jgi:hypothetical protein
MGRIGMKDRGMAGNGVRGQQKAARRRLLQIQLFSLENGAGEGIRTLDPNLGKVVLYP